MAKYLIQSEWSGYSRGIGSCTVEAESEEEARDMYMDCESEHTVVRDDTENEITSVTLIEEK